MSYTNGLDKPTDYFNTKLYTGNASTNAITGVGFQPDWVWLKNRSSAYHHRLFDSVRGTTKNLSSNRTDAESTESGLTSFDSDGFTLGSDGGANNNTDNYVAWNWKAGGSASSNTDGSITSTVSANTTAGFSIVNWTGSSSASVQTIGHGLGTTPHWILSKNRGSGSSITAWINYHHKIDASAPEDYTIYLNNSDARVDNPVFGDTAPTSTVFSFNTGTDDQNYISYCFTEKKGFSKFGNYVGNGDADGPYVHLGFRPAMVIIKNTTNSNDWVILDNKRNTFNLTDKTLFPDLNVVEDTTSANMDFLSNGFKIRDTRGADNTSSSVYIYMAFAEAPFVNSNGVPNNAR